MRTLFAIVLSLLTLVSSSFAADWPQWRGPTGNGVSQETNLPVNWSEQRGIVWKADIPEWGDSTPAIWGDAIFLTSQKDDDLLVLKLDKATGHIAWTQTVGTGTPKRAPIKGKSPTERKEQKFHNLQNMATPSPVTNGQVVVVHFGNGDLAAYDFAGKQLWHHNLQTEYGTYTIWWGHANSPVIYGNSVISVCMQDSLADVVTPPVESYIVAHDLHSGKVLWKVPRMTGAKAEECDAYTTPVFTQVDGQTQMIVMGGNQVDAYDPATGKQLWFLPKIVGGRTVTGPVVADGLVFVTRGKSGPLLAVKFGGRGELPPQSIVWHHEEGTPDSSTPVAWENHLFSISDHGIARCYDLHSGREEWYGRLKGDHKASPVVADGKVYFLNTHGLCTVVAAGSHFDVLSENQLDDETIASPAISDGHIFIRGHKARYCIGRDN